MVNAKCFSFRSNSGDQGLEIRFKNCEDLEKADIG